MNTKNNPGPEDCYAKAKDDEPIFVLRANDPTAPGVVQHWVRMNKDFRPADKIESAEQCAIAMKKWRRENI